MLYDVAVIGAGVVGSLTARFLTKYKLKVCLVEAENDVSEGASKANSGIVHAGYDPIPGSSKAKFNLQGSRMMEALCKELSVKYRQNGSLVLAFDNNDIAAIKELYHRGTQNGITDLRIIDKNELLKIEPNVSKKAISALYAPSAGTVCPYNLTIAAAENAVTNGAEVFLDSAVTAVEKINDYYRIYAGNNIIDAKIVVNAAGAGAENIAKLFGDDSVKLNFRKGEYIICDKAYGNLTIKVLFRAPTPLGKGVLVTPTVDGNLLIGPNSVDTKDEFYKGTTANGLNEVIEKASSLVPDLPLGGALTEYTGVRAGSDSGDFIIGFSPKAENLFNLAGIDSPGLTASPAIAEYTAKIIAEKLCTDKNDNFNPNRLVTCPISEMNGKEREKAIAENPLYGHIVCRCENVSEAEIVDAIHRPIKAHTIDGVKRRVRAGMGRCQGGFCGPIVAKIIARELDIPLEKVLKDKNGSEILVGKLDKGAEL